MNPRVLTACLLVGLLAACTSSESATPSAPGPNTSMAPPAPSSFGGPTTDSGSRYADPSAPVGAVVVETPPTAGTYTPEGWPVGATSIARPAQVPPRPPTPAGAAPASPRPQATPPEPSRPTSSGDLPPPVVSPPPPPARR